MYKNLHYFRLYKNLHYFLFSNRERPIELLRSDRRREINRAIREESIRLRGRGFRSLIDVRSELKSEIVKDQMKMNGVAQVICNSDNRFF